VPHAPIDGALSRGVVDDTANTDNCLSSAWLWQEGQAGVRDAVTSVSNWW